MITPGTINDTEKNQGKFLGNKAECRKLHPDIAKQIEPR